SSAVTTLVFTVNLPPVLSAIGPKSVAEGETISITPSATDPESGSVTITAEGALPAGAAFTGGTFSWAPDYNSSGSYSVTFRADDGVNFVEETVSITVTNTNRTPSMAAIGDKAIAEGESLTINPICSDPDGTAVTLTATTALPSGAVFNNGQFSWTPGYNQAGNYSVTFRASDGSLYADQTVSIAVSNVNRAPVLEPIGNRSVEEGHLLSLTLAGSDPDGTQLAFTFTPSVEGASISGSTFTFSPDYAMSGDYSFTFRATDGSAFDEEAISVSVTNVNRPPVLSAIGAKSVVAGSLLSFGVSASDPDGDSVSVSSGALPADATFSGGVFGWIPEAGKSGNYNVSFTASDGSLSDSETVLI
ncbi:tandem-95 repeat protein, partial [bacterium]